MYSLFTITILGFETWHVGESRYGWKGMFVEQPDPLQAIMLKRCFMYTKIEISSALHMLVLVGGVTSGTTCLVIDTNVVSNVLEPTYFVTMHVV